MNSETVKVIESALVGRCHGPVVERVIAEVKRGSQMPDFCVVCPPGLGGRALAKEMKAGVESAGDGLRAVVVNVDALQHPEEYLALVAAQSGRAWDRQPNLTWDRAFQEAPSVAGGPIVQILRRFHRVGDILKVPFLSALRTAEELDTLHSIVVTPVDYAGLRHRWRESGEVITVSDYGRCHVRLSVRPLHKDEMLAACCPRIPRHVIEWVHDLAGGYYDATVNCLSEWERMGRPERLSSEVRRRLTGTAEDAVDRFVEWLDVDGDYTYRRWVVGFVDGASDEQALAVLREHPWAELVLGPSGLRARCVGEVALRHILRDMAKRLTPPVLAAEKAGLAEQLYRVGEYGKAEGVLASSSSQESPGFVVLSERHAKFMAGLVGSSGSAAGTDTDWHGMVRCLEECCERLGSAVKVEEDRQRLSRRYAELKDVCESISSAVRIDERVVDVLIGIRGPALAWKPVAALFVMKLCLNAAEGMEGASATVTAALPLPEQAFRAWAFWSSGMNFYSAPEIAPPVYDMLSRVWQHGPLPTVKAGQQFPSFEVFAQLTFLVWKERGGHMQGSGPAESMDVLKDRLATLSAVRNPPAHSIAVGQQGGRRRHLEIARAWYSCAAQVCPNLGAVGIVEGLTQPLPLVHRNGELEWL